MHGLIFAGLRDFSRGQLEQDAFERVWAGHTYEQTEAYDDEEFRARLGEIQAASGVSVEQLERDFGVFAAETTFAELYPDYYTDNVGTIPFLLGIEQRIHTVVRATIPGAYPPKLHVRPLGEDGVLLSYTSERRLCRMLEGLIHGVASHYGERLVVEEIQCMHRDDPGCVFTVLNPVA